MLVVIAGAELFTGNNLMISSAMSGSIGMGRMLERWGLVYVANFIGSILLALLFVYSGLWKTSDGALGAYAVRVAYTKVNLSFVEALLRGVGCNWLVCLAVWMALASRQTIGKIFAIFFPIMGFVALGFEHSVANMYFIPTGILLRTFGGLPATDGFDPSSLGWASFLVRNLLPVTIRKHHRRRAVRRNGILGSVSEQEQGVGRSTRGARPARRASGPVGWSRLSYRAPMGEAPLACWPPDEDGAGAGLAAAAGAMP